MRKRNHIVWGPTSCWALCAALVILQNGLAAETQQEDPGAGACELRIEGRAIQKLLLMDQRGGDVEIDRPGQSVALPAGEYYVREVVVEGGYRARRLYVWTDRGACPATPGFDTFNLRPDEPHTLRIGAPLRPSVEVDRQGRILKLDYKLLDAAGRQYLPQSLEGRPSFAVFNGDRQVGSGRFEYG